MLILYLVYNCTKNPAHIFRKMLLVTVTYNILWDDYTISYDNLTQVHTLFLSINCEYPPVKIILHLDFCLVFTVCTQVVKFTYNWYVCSYAIIDTDRQSNIPSRTQENGAPWEE